METVTITPMNTIEMIPEMKACINTLLKTQGERTTIEFIKALSGMTKEQVTGLLILYVD